MYQIDFRNPVKVHFCGIGGISMSGLAAVLLKEGFSVTGSDSKKSALTELLESKGAKISYPQKADNITQDQAVVVYTAAIHPDNPEYAQAAAMGKPMLTRAQLLGQIMDNYSNSIAVSGTHGKTTTTSMLSCILLQANLDPTISVGGILREIGGNIRVGNSQNFITEACEYTNSFLSLKPKIGLILNIDADHLDYYKDIDDIECAFGKFLALLPEDGTAIGWGEDARIMRLFAHLSIARVTFGFSRDNDYYPDNLVYSEFGCPEFDVMRGGEKQAHLKLQVAGKFSVLNALAAFAAAREAGAGAEGAGLAAGAAAGAGVVGIW